MTIRVLRRHIKAGCKKECSRCPIALAMIEATGTKWLVGTIDVSKAGSTKDFNLPSNARAFIRQFDRGEPVKPFTFKITLQND